MLEAIALYNILIPALEISADFDSRRRVFWPLGVEFVETEPTMSDSAFEFYRRAVPNSEPVTDATGNLEYVTYTYNETSPVSAQASSYDIIRELLNEDE